MASVNSTAQSYYSNSASTSHGMSGLVSGLDTESMVEKMLSGTQAKIDKQEALKQQTTWKQNIYRDIISQISGFQSKYFDVLSPTNLLSGSFYNAMTATSSSSAVKVSANSSTPSGTSYMKVLQMATKASYKASATASGTLKSTVSADDLAYVTMTVAGKTLSVDMNGITETKDLVKKLNETFVENGVNAMAEMTDDGKLVFDQDITVDASSTSVGLTTLGLTAGLHTAGTESGMRISAYANPATVDFYLDGVKKTITLDATGTKTAEENMVDNLQKSLDKAFGKNIKYDADGNPIKDASGNVIMESAVKVEYSGGEMKVETADGSRVLVSGSSKGLKALGLTSGASDRINTALKLSELNFKEELQGDSYRFTINGVDFEFSKEDTLNSIMNKVNASDAGVRITYSPAEDKFNIESTSSGAGMDIEMSQSAGNLLSSMFGTDVIDKSASIIGKELGTKTVVADDAKAADFEAFTEGSFVMNVNGSDVRVSFVARPDYDKGGYKQWSKKEVIEKINETLLGRFGTDATGAANIELSEDGKTFDVKNGAIVKFNSDEANVANKLGFGGKNNVATEDTKLSELGAGFDLTGIVDASGNPLGADQTIGDIAPGLLDKDDYGRFTGRLTLNKDNFDQSGLPADVVKKLFGSNSISAGSFGDGKMTATAGNYKTEGQDARIIVGDSLDSSGNIQNGTIINRKSNNFDLNGITVDVQKVTDEIVTIGVDRDTESIYKALETFVTDYNELIDKLNKYVDADAEYKDYPPLTEAQKKEMTDSQIEKWEEKAQVGLIRNDSTVSGFLSAMRTIMYSKPEGSRISLFDLGIETSSDWKEKGKLVIKDKSATKQAVETYATEIQQLFTDSKNGIAVQMQNAIKAVANTSSAAPGALVELAGLKGKASETNNTMYKQLKTIEDKIKNLKNTYNMQKTRYWKQFNAMEQVVSNMNTQSSWLMSQMG